MKKFLITIFLLITLNKVNSFNLGCTYRHDKEGYCCQASTIHINSRNDRNVTSVTGAHLGGMNNNKVVVFHTDGKTVNFMLRNLEEFFPNIEVIQIFRANLMEVKMDDFKPYGEKLKKVWLNKP